MKSYDFMFTKDSYVVGTVIDRSPVDFLCSGTEYLHIRILADCRIVDGEEARNYERMGEMCYVACVGSQNWAVRESIPMLKDFDSTNEINRI